MQIASVGRSLTSWTIALARASAVTSYPILGNPTSTPISKAAAGAMQPSSPVWCRPRQCDKGYFGSRTAPETPSVISSNQATFQAFAAPQAQLLVILEPLA